MPVIAITREMGSLGKEVAAGIGEALGIPVLYHEVVDPLADRMRVRKSHVIRLLDGNAGLLERLTADRTSMHLYSSDEIIACAMQGKGAVIRGWGATHVLRDVSHVVCVRVCAPLELRKQRMMERLETDDAEKVAVEIHINDEAHGAIMRRNFGIQWGDPERYDVVLNTKRVRIEHCVDEVLGLVRSPEFAETGESRQQLEDLALTASVRAALRRAPETRDISLSVTSRSGRVTLAAVSGGTDGLLTAVEVVAAVPGVRDIEYRAHAPEGSPQRLH